MKIIKGLMAAAVTGLLACGCSQQAGSAQTNANVDSASAQTSNSSMVQVTLPASLFQSLSQEDIEEAAKKDGFESCTINEDGTVTYTMTAQKQQEMKDQLKQSFVTSINNLMKDKSVPASYVNVEYNDNCSIIDVYVNPSAYKQTDTSFALGMFLPGVYYQCFAGTDVNKVDVIINFINKNTKEPIETASFKRMMREMEKAS